MTICGEGNDCFRGGDFPVCDLADVGDSGEFGLPGVEENLEEKLESQEFRRPPDDGDGGPDLIVLPFTIDPTSTDRAL